MGALAAALRPAHVEEALRGISAPVKALVHRMLHREPGERYATAARLQAELQACLRTLAARPHGAREAALELLMARTQAEASARREGAALTERAVFAEDVPGYS